MENAVDRSDGNAGELSYFLDRKGVFFVIFNPRVRTRHYHCFFKLSTIQV